MSQRSITKPISSKEPRRDGAIRFSVLGDADVCSWLSFRWAGGCEADFGGLKGGGKGVLGERGERWRFDLVGGVL